MFFAVWEMRMALSVGLSAWVSMSCLCAVRSMALTSICWVSCVRSAAPKGFKRREGVFIWRASAGWRWCN